MSRTALPPLQDSYSYQSYQRQRQLTLGDLLLENRIVFLQGEIYSGNANELVMKLLYLQSENRRKDIHFYLNSPGGDVIATLAIYDTMQILSCPVATYCVGQAASGAAVLLAGGTKGKRYALPHARVMMHQPYGGVGGQISDIEIQTNEILRNRELLNNILAQHSGKPVDQIATDTDRDFFLSAEQAKEYVRREMSACDPAALAQATRAVIRFSSRNWAADISVPTAVVVTTRDKIVPTRRQYALAAAIPNAKQYEVEGDHFACADRSTGFVAKLVAACDHVDAAATRRAIEGEPHRLKTG